MGITAVVDLVVVWIELELLVVVVLIVEVVEVLSVVVVVVVVVGSGLSVGTSPALTHPVLSVNAFGQVICLNVILGLSALRNQSKRHLQPAFNFSGKVSH